MPLSLPNTFLIGPRDKLRRRALLSTVPEIVVRTLKSFGKFPRIMRFETRAFALVSAPFRLLETQLWLSILCTIHGEL